VNVRQNIHFLKKGGSRSKVVAAEAKGEEEIEGRGARQRMSFKRENKSSNSNERDSSKNGSLGAEGTVIDDSIGIWGYPKLL